MKFATGIAVPVGDEGGGSGGQYPWGNNERDMLCAWAAEFKAKGDMGGVHLCGVVEEEMARHAKEGGCRVVGEFYLALVMTRHADGADHELAHLFLPRIVEMLQAAKHRADLVRLKEEVGIE